LDAVEPVEKEDPAQPTGSNNLHQAAKFTKKGDL
jgi:hypothetical protein